MTETVNDIKMRRCKKLKLSALVFDLNSHFIFDHEVDYSLDYKKLIKEAGLKIEENKPAYDYYKEDINTPSVAERYLDHIPEKNKKKESIMLVKHFGNLKSYSDYIKWGLKNDLKLSTPPVIFAIAKNISKMDFEPKNKPHLYLVETRGHLRSDNLTTGYCRISLDKTRFTTNIGSPHVDTILRCGWIAFVL